MGGEVGQAEEWWKGTLIIAVRSGKASILYQVE